MPSSLTPTSLRSCRRVGVLVLLLGLALGGIILADPSSLRVPMGVGLLACGAIALSGAVMGLHGLVSPVAAGWLAATMLACLAAVPSWLSLSAQAGRCVASVRWLGGETACRAAFGLGALLAWGFVAVAVRQALRRRQPPGEGV